MFSLIRGLFFLLLCLVGIGLYRGWFSFSTPSHDPQGNRVNINVSLDENKMEADAKKAEQKIMEKVAAEQANTHSDGTSAQQVK